MILDQIYGFGALDVQISVLEYSIEFGTLIPDWVGVSGEMKFCFLAEAKKLGISVQEQPQALYQLAPHMQVIEVWADAVGQKCPTLTHPWASKHIGANLTVRLYMNKNLGEGDFLGAVYNHKMCIQQNGLLLRPLNLETGTVFVDFQGKIGPASCDKWNIASEKLGNMPEALGVSEVWQQIEPKVKELCSRFKSNV